MISFPGVKVTSRDLLAGTSISLGWRAPLYSTEAYNKGAAAQVVLARPHMALVMSLT